MDLIKPLKDKIGTAVFMAGDLTRIVVDTLEQTSHVALESCRYYNGVGMQQLRAFAMMRDLASIRSFLGGSVALSADLLKHVIKDFQKSAALATEMRIAIEDTLSSVTPPEPVAATRNKAITKSVPV